MSYTALYRKFRPAVFEDVKGQEHIVTTLKNQIKAERIGHAYLFTGTRGTGKTTIAKIFAKAVNCENPVDGSPCGDCPTCRAIASGASMNVIEIDAASNNGVDNIRQIVEEVSYSPTEGKYKVYIIDEVHMLSLSAFNALLKTLEEPPSYVIFILATTEVNKIPITILSRCQRYDFRRISIDTIAARMRELMDTEQIDVDDKALRYVARLADGSMRDGLSLLDQCLAFHFGEKLTYDMALDVLGAVDTEVFSNLFRRMLAGDVPGCIEVLDKIVLQGRELSQFITDYTWYLRNLMLAKTTDNIEDVIDVSSDNLALLKEEAQMADLNAIMRYIRIFSELTDRLRAASQKRILIEMALIKTCRPAMEQDQEAVLERIRMLEDQVKNGVFVRGDAGQAAASAVPRKARPELPKAIPEEVKDAATRWPMIVGSAVQPMKSYIKDAKLSVDNEGRLLIVVEDGMASDYFTEIPENKQVLMELLEDVIGKHIEVDIRKVGSVQEAEDNFADLLSAIGMEIDVEEDEE